MTIHDLYVMFQWFVLINVVALVMLPALMLVLLVIGAIIRYFSDPVGFHNMEPDREQYRDLNGRDNEIHLQ